MLLRTTETLNQKYSIATFTLHVIELTRQGGGGDGDGGEAVLMKAATSSG